MTNYNKCSEYLSDIEDILIKRLYDSIKSNIKPKKHKKIKNKVITKIIIIDGKPVPIYKNITK